MNRTSKFWREFELARRQERREAGASKQVAKHAAAFETRLRRKMVALVGAKAAVESDLRLVFRLDGTFRADLEVKYSAIPVELRARAEAWAANPTAPVQ